ncbi:PD-(D/E)XK nuclease family protein [Kineobactrum salinum]|uniref:PD-(D/E)XK nuclease family protein n=1 Tax=Kineobactrum salinum TaxID=2708301 RepID=A0A6C0U4P3_9GAMM|nr:PD-(D/E)XK nuclease family protein [Kineobactrum salinum]QIB67120.1 PD-(D/E)XK nuclease family protein [Kineobactrum salinum]
MPTWSATMLKKYETCAYSVYLERVKKVPQEKNVASDRGSALHDIAECYVKSEWEAIADTSQPFIKDWEDKIYPKFRADFDHLRDRFAEGKVEVEGNWGFTVDWEPTGWMGKDVWARAKLDVLEWQDENCARVIDHKSGKKFGNEIPHAQQAMIYAIAAFMRYEQLEFVETDFWYLDHGLYSPQRYSRQQASQFLPRITQRATVLTSDTEFKPTPSKGNCMWCPFRANEACEWRVE